MYKFSQISKDRLETVHTDLQTLFNEVIKYVDCSIISGLRTQEEQFELYKRGREKLDINDQWVVVDEEEVVTHKDGTYWKSKHQLGNAIDVVPYPSLYRSKFKLIRFGGFVLGVAKMLKEQGKINSNIIWGGDWNNFKDYPHFEIKNQP